MLSFLSYSTLRRKDNSTAVRTKKKSLQEQDWLRKSTFRDLLPTIFLIVGVGLGLNATPANISSFHKPHEICLNGKWDEGGMVPVYAGIYLPDSMTYRKRIEIPINWDDQVIKLEFLGVNFTADVYVNENNVGQHIGGWVPFSMDITRLVQPGQASTLRLVVKGRRQPPYVEKANHDVFLWPSGNLVRGKPEQDDQYGGIVDDVWLRAYGKVHIEDAFIQTSFRRHEIKVDYTLFNADSHPRTVNLHARALDKPGGAVAKELPLQTATMAPGERKTVSVTTSWENPQYWWPGRPHLYYLETILQDGNTPVDQETRRFGFREFYTDGRAFRINGVRFNITSDYGVYGETQHLDIGDTPEKWARLIEFFQGLNIRMLRFHKRPSPQYTLDVADQMGFCIKAESAVPGQSGGKVDWKTLLSNYPAWCAEWIKANRNHPSILIWSAANEIESDPDKAHAVGHNVIRPLDPTRPIIYENANNPWLPQGVSLDIASLHYPRPSYSAGAADTTAVTGPLNKKWGGDGEPWGHDQDMYTVWNSFIHPAMPTSMGEGMYVPASSKPKPHQLRNAWWQGIWSRGMRYNGWAEIGPSSYRWLRNEPSLNTLKVRNLRNAYAPVALFDKEYDGLGLKPYPTGVAGNSILPVLTSGETVSRTLVMYNDEFDNTAVTAKVLLRVGETVVASKQRDFVIPLGEHIEFPCRFRAPSGTGELVLVLQTFKGGRLTFEEERRFMLSGKSIAKQRPVKISLGDAVVVPMPVIGNSAK